MGCSSSNIDQNMSNKLSNKLSDKFGDEDRVDTLNIANGIEYKFKQYNFTSDEPNKCLIAYTLSEDKDSDFYEGSNPNNHCKQTLKFKSSDHNIAIYYSKGSKEKNQDKFFLIINDQLEIYCVVDGHGPYGDILAQITENLCFEYFSDNSKFDIDAFDESYENEFNVLFDNINKKLIEDNPYSDNKSTSNIDNNNNKNQKYDAILSGCSLTLVVKIGIHIYHANVGNILAYLWTYEDNILNCTNVTQLSFDDSNFNMELINGNQDSIKNEEYYNSNKTKTKFIYNHLIQPNKIDEEIRRIYEHKGEARNLSDNGKCRIFMKGKYFPGIINTRSLGDLVASSIGCINTPHITKTDLIPGNKYYLLIISDGINDKLKIYNFINTFQEKGLLLLESLTQAVTYCKNIYQDNGYLPDMTGIIKEITQIDDN